MAPIFKKSDVVKVAIGDNSNFCDMEKLAKSSQKEEKKSNYLLQTRKLSN
jgi:hypothetical protein